MKRLLTSTRCSALLLLGVVQAGQPLSAADVAPVPRDASGRVLISSAPGEARGLWAPDYSRGVPIMFDPADVAFKPWSQGLYEARQAHDLEPHARCKASGGARQLLTPYGVEILELPELQRLYIFDIGGPHSYREVFMDGRSHPPDTEASSYGRHIGWWDGDTLVVDSLAYNTKFWFERFGLPHTEAVHVTEYFTRLDHDSLDYRFVMDDPLTYNAPVEMRMRLNWIPEEEVFEYVCQQSNYAPELMVNDALQSVGRSSPITP